MKTIKIKFVDFFRDFDPLNNTITNILKEMYVVEMSDDPDYLFYSSFGREFLKYDCVKIYYTGECIVPDFNLCDYAIAFEQMTFGDRYIRVPLYELFQYRKEYQNLLNKSIIPSTKTSFCSIVVSNDQGMKERTEIVDLLNQYKLVDSGGRYRNNVGGPVKSKMEFDRKHKFSICFENCSHIGYTTEKLVQAFAADTIPIYLGNPNIANEFNINAFVNVSDYPTLQDAVKRVIEIDMDDDLYMSIKKEPIITGARADLKELSSFLYNIFDQPLNQARRRPINTRVREKEEEQRVFSIYMKLIGKNYKRFKSLIRRFKNNAL